MPKKKSLEKIVFPGKGVVIGSTPEGNPFGAYFITAKTSFNRQQRMVDVGPGIIVVEHLDPARVTDDNIERLFYDAMISNGDALAIGNGNHTDAVLIRSIGAMAGLPLEKEMGAWSYGPGRERAPRIMGRILLESHHGGIMRNDTTCSFGMIYDVDGRAERRFYDGLMMDNDPPGFCRCLTTHSGLRGPVLLPSDGGLLEFNVDSNEGERLCQELGDMLPRDFRVSVAVTAYKNRGDKAFRDFYPSFHILNYRG